MSLPTESNSKQDTATAIWNRESIIELLAREIARATQESHELFVMLVRVDQLSSIHGEYGPQLGDWVLGEIARQWSSFLRRYDHIGRYGPEHLLILPLSYDRSGVASLAEKLRETVAHQPMQVSRNRIHVTVSIGLASFADFPSRNVEELLAELERSLQRAEVAGGNRIVAVRNVDTNSNRASHMRQGIPTSWILAAVALAIAIGLYLFPAWVCAPFRLGDVFDSGEMTPPMPANCSATTETPSEATLQSLEKQRQDRGLILTGRMTCKLLDDPKSHSDRARQQQWLDNFYIDGMLQYRRHVFLAATQEVHGGTLFTVEVGLIPAWAYMNQPEERCWEKYAFWK